MDKNEVGLTVGSWGQRRGEFDIGRNFEDSGVAFRVMGAIERADNYRDVMNLFDREYIVSGQGSSPNLNLPGAPRAVQLNARYKF